MLVRYHIQMRHAWHYYDVAVHVIRQFVEQQQLEQTLFWFDLERPQIDVALGWLLQESSPDTSHLLVRYNDALSYLQGLRYDYTESYEERLGGALAAAQRIEAGGAEARILGSLGTHYLGQGKLEQAADMLERSLSRIRHVGGQRDHGRTLGNLALLYMQLGRLSAAKDLYEEALTLAKQAHEPIDEGLALLNLGIVSMHLHDLDQAFAYFSQALDLSAQTGDQLNQARVLLARSRALLDQGDILAAHRDSTVALELATIIGDRDSKEQAQAALDILASQYGVALPRESDQESSTQSSNQYLTEVQSHLHLTNLPMPARTWRVQFQGHAVQAELVTNGKALLAWILSPRDGFLIVLPEFLVEQRVRSRQVDHGTAAIELALGTLLTATRRTQPELRDKQFEAMYDLHPKGTDIISGPADLLSVWQGRIYTVILLMVVPDAAS